MTYPTHTPADEEGEAGSSRKTVPVAPSPAPPRLPKPLCRQPAFLAALVHAASNEDRVVQIRNRLSEMGFCWLTYGQLSLSNSTTLTSIGTGIALDKWAERYFREEYFDVDRRLIETAGSGLPYVWDLETLGQPSIILPVSKLNRFISDLRNVGGHSGISLRLLGHYPRSDAYLSLMSNSPGCDWMDDELLGKVLNFATCLHEFYSNHATTPDLLDALSLKLTPVQLDMMRCLLRGMGDKAIASELKLSLHNVDYHMRQLRRRFGANNRVKLVHEAMRIVGTARRSGHDMES